MNLIASIRQRERSSHLKDLERRTGSLCWSRAELCRLDSREFRHQSRHESPRQAGVWAAKRRNAWRNRHPDASWPERRHLVDSRQTWKATKEQREEIFLSFLTRQAEPQQWIFLWFPTSLGLLLSPSIPLHKHKLWVKTLWYLLLLSFHISSEFGGNKTFTSKQTYIWGKVQIPSQN